LEEGLEKDLALQAAQKTFLANNQELKNMPFYWAGFVVSGDVAPVYRSSLPFIAILIAIVIIGLLVVIFIGKMNRNTRNTIGD